MIYDEPKYKHADVNGKSIVRLSDPTTEKLWGYVYMDSENYRIVAVKSMDDGFSMDRLYCDSLETASMWLRGLI